MTDYKKIALKIGRMGFFTDIHNCGAPTENWPVNLYCEMKGLRFYVAEIKGSGWCIDYTRDSEIIKRADMTSISGIKNQTNALLFVKALINNLPVTRHANGTVTIEEEKRKD